MSPGDVERVGLGGIMGPGEGENVDIMCVSI